MEINGLTRGFRILKKRTVSVFKILFSNKLAELVFPMSFSEAQLYVSFTEKKFSDEFSGLVFR